MSLLLVVAVGCDKSDTPTDTPDDAVAATPVGPDAVSSCFDRIETWTERPNKPPEERDTEWQGINKDCGALYQQCGGVQTTTAFVRGGNRGLVLDLADKCAQAYCGGFEPPKPALCSGARAVMEGKDADATTAAALEFHKRVLEADVGGGPQWDPVAQKLAELWTGYGEVDMMGDLGDAAALGFKVKVTPAGFELQTAAAHKWAAGTESTSLKLALLPAASGKKGKKKKAKKGEPAAGTPQPGQWDYAALAKEAKSLKAAHPEETAVTLVVDDKVPAEVQTNAMNALRGEGCTLESDASPATVPPECAFWRQILQ